MSDIFISYNRKNRSIADALAKDFHQLGHAAWLDEELSGGQLWWNEILARVRQCDVFVFVLDRESLVSVACSSEYNYANALGKPILPIRVSPDVSDASLPSALSMIQYVDYSVEDRNAAFCLARALSGIKSSPPLPDPLPAPPEVPLSYLGKLVPIVTSSGELTRAEQADLVFQLKEGLNDPDTVNETRDLLQQLRRRSDLFARVAKDIDVLLEDPASLQTTQLRQGQGGTTPIPSGMTGHHATASPWPGHPGTQPAPPPITPRRFDNPPPTPPPNIPNYLTWAIVSVFCCWPLAIGAIINATQVNSKIAVGDYAGAAASSKNARTFAIIAIVLGVLGIGAYLVLTVLGAAMQASNSSF